MNRIRPVLLPLILVAAVAVRAWGLAFGLPAATARPDETQIAGAALGFMTGDLRPPFFQWPMLFAYGVALVYILFVAVGRFFGGYQTQAAFAASRRQNIGPFLLMPRVLSLILGVATVWWVYGIARRTFDRSVALVAALFLAFAFLAVRDSHFGVTDGPMTALVVAAVIPILRWREDGGVRFAVLAGLATGVAASTKYNGALVGVAFLAAAGLRATDKASPGPIKRAAFGVAVYSLASAAAFFSTSPYVLLEWARFRADTAAVQATLAGGHVLVLEQGWKYYATTILPAAVGWPIFIAGVAGLIVLLTTRFRQAIVVLAFPLVYYAIAGRGYAVFARYILPVVPFLCIAAAWFVVWAMNRVTSGWTAEARGGAIAVAALVLVAPTAWNTILLDRLLARTDNRVIVSRELFRTLPPGSSFFQSDALYGQAPPFLDNHGWPVEHASFDAASGRFSPADPEWVLIPRSPLLLYNIVPETLERRLREHYELARAFPTEEWPAARFYDQQDAFYLPMTGLAGLERPGPSFELYRLRR